MNLPSPRASEGDARLGAGAGPLLAIVLIGLLTDVARPEEAYAGIGYGLWLLAFLGAAGGAVRLTSRLHTSLDPLPWAAPATPAFGISPGLHVRGERWPLLVALLFGPLVVLISGLGGWV